MTSEDRYRHEIIGSRYVLRGLFRRGEIWHYRARDIHHGTMFERSTRMRSAARARREAVRQLEDLVRMGRGGGSLDLEFIDLFRAWLDARPGLRPRTRQGYERDLRGVYAPAFGGRLVSSIEGRDVQGWLAGLQSRRPDGLSPATRRRHLQTLRSFFRWARVVRGAIGHDPTAGIRVERGERRRVPRTLSLEDIRRLLVAAKEPYWATQPHGSPFREEFRSPPEWLWLALLVAFHSGLRRANVLGLRWSWIDLGRRRLVVPAVATKQRREHWVPIHPELAEVLCATQRASSRGATDDDLVIPGAPTETPQKALRSACRRAGVPEIRWHDIRHTCGTLWAERVPYATLQALLGHAPTEVTWHYLHTPWERLRDAMDSFPRLLSSESSSG